jgi:hypothetical protein
MLKTRLRVNLNACALAVMLVALVAGSRVARADEAGASEELVAAEPPAAPAAVVAGQTAPAEAVVEHAAPPAEVPPKPETSWYGWQTLLSDAATIGLGALAYAADDAKYGSPSPQNYELGANALFAAGVATYALGGPAIHWAHGNGRKGLASLGLRVGMPLGGFIAGLLIGNAACGNDDSEFVSCPVALGALAFLGGMVAAPVVDAAVIAREPVTPPTGPRFQAAVVPSGGGGKFVLAGRF